MVQNRVAARRSDADRSSIRARRCTLDATQESGPSVRATQFAMGTIMSYTVFGPAARASLAAACGEIERLDSLLSRFSADSEIARINRGAGREPVPIGPQTHAVLLEASAFSRRCPDCFAVTVGPLVDLWNIGVKSLHRPDQSKIEQARGLVNDGDLILDPLKPSAGLRRAGQSVDLGAIGKGFAGDRIREVFHRCGIRAAYANLGGNVVAVGSRPDGLPWRIGIQHPRDTDRLIGCVSVVDRSAVTSGDYQRYVTDSRGNRHHHILDPSTGYPADSGLISVTVVSPGAMVADALATALFVAGIERGLELLEHYPGTDAVFVHSDLRVSITAGLKHRFQAGQNTEFTIMD